MGGFSSKKLAELEVPKSGAYTKKVIDWYVWRMYYVASRSYLMMTQKILAA